MTFACYGVLQQFFRQTGPQPQQFADQWPSLSFLFPCDSFVQAIPGLLRADTGPQQTHWCFMPRVELCQNPLMWWNVVEIVVLDTAELELQLEVDVVIQIAPYRTSMRYSLTERDTMAKVHLCSKMPRATFFFCWAFALLSCCLCFVLPTSLSPNTTSNLSI